jgi:Helix-loop-helix DNA-binding domain
MKPKDSSPPKPTTPVAKPKETGKPSTNNTNSKKKQPSATSAAGRKIARKTAHSLIERRRRSKMNEEFNTLKNMIPACKGQEMHKLAILQVCLKKPSLSYTFPLALPTLSFEEDRESSSVIGKY